MFLCRNADPYFIKLVILLETYLEEDVVGHVGCQSCEGLSAGTSHPD